MTLAQQSSKDFSFAEFPVCGVNKCRISTRRFDVWKFRCSGMWRHILRRLDPDMAPYRRQKPLVRPHSVTSPKTSAKATVKDIWSQNFTIRRHECHLVVINWTKWRRWNDSTRNVNIFQLYCCRLRYYGMLLTLLWLANCFRSCRGALYPHLQNQEIQIWKWRGYSPSKRR